MERRDDLHGVRGVYPFAGFAVPSKATVSTVASFPDRSCVAEATSKVSVLLFFPNLVIEPLSKPPFTAIVGIFEPLIYDV